MKIHLKNFKCWNKKTVELDQNGIQLLTGESGKGKSSIMDAIYFCLYGELQKIITHGEKSCEVKIHHNDIFITRSRRPNRLIVETSEEKYEDDVAQEFINEKFGNYFIQTSYIKQNSYDNFIYMSPSEKLEFLEESILKKYKVDKLKTKIQNAIKKLDIEIIELTSQYNTYSKIYEDLKEPVKVEFPISCSEKNRETVIKNENVKLSNTNILIKKVNKKIMFCKETKILLDKIENEMQVLTMKMEELNILKKEYLKKIGGLCIRNDDKIEFIQKKISDIEKYETYQKLTKELLKEEKFYNEKLEEELGSCRSKYKDIDESIVKDLEIKIDIVKNNLKYIPIVEDLKNRISKIPSVLEKYNDKTLLETLTKTNVELQHKLEMLNTVLKCPCCEKMLTLRNRTLEIYNDSLQNEKELKETIDENNRRIDKIKKTLKNAELLEKLTNQLSEVVSNIVDTSDISESLDTLKKKYNGLQSDMIESKKIKILLESRDFPSLHRSKDIIKTLKAKIEKIGEIEAVESDKENLIEELDRIKLNLRLSEEYNITIKSTESKIEKIKIEIDELSIKRENLKLEKNYDLEDLNSKLEEYQRDLEIVTSNIDKIEKWKKYQEETIKYNEIRQKITDIKNSLDDKREELKLCEILKNNVIQAETIAVKHFIDTINCQVQSYLDKFFKNDQLLVKLDTEKQLKGKKTTKSQITLNMEYKGHSIDVGNLSGGEISRLNLAFVLALSEIFQSPILMLDECISTLDPDNCVNVLETIKEQYKGEIVLMVHHQITEGLFDKVINL